MCTLPTVLMCFTTYYITSHGSPSRCTTRTLNSYLPLKGKIHLNSYNKTNEMHQFLEFIFGIELYMFWTGFLSIIRSLVLYTQQ